LKKFALDDKSLFDKKIRFLMKLGHMPSLSACIIKNNRVVWSKAYGKYDIENDLRATTNTIYMIASITKTITATAVLQLYEKGLIDIDHDVNEYLPFKLRNPHFPDDKITVRMLLAHQSSLADSPEYLFTYFSLLNYPYGWLKEYLTPGGYIYNPKIWTNKRPGDDVYYTSVGMELLGYIVEQISKKEFGESFEEYCKNHIFDPLKMQNTGFSLPDYQSKEIAVPYIFLAGRYLRLPYYTTGISAAGGLRSTVLDISHFLMAYLNGGVYNGTSILQPGTIDEAFRIQYPNSWDDGYQWGLGWYFKKRWDGEIYGGHSGIIIGSRAVMRFRKSDKVGVIFFYNQNQMIGKREQIRIVGRIEKFARSMVEKSLFKKAEEFS